MFTAAAPLPYYSAYGFGQAGRPPSSKKASVDSTKAANDESSAISPPKTDGNAAIHSGNIHEFLEPAIDGPPSPERIRALSKQMRRASVRDVPAPPSTHFLAQDRLSWEQSMEAFDLSRRSSGRSTTSSRPSRDRPESVQIFGKTIFNRMGRAKRESSANSSSGSSLYSTDLPVDGPAPQTKEHYIPGLFGRKKAQKSGIVAGDRPRSNSASKKLQISGPYNFHHVSHTQRDHYPSLSAGSRSDLSADWAGFGTAQPPPSSDHSRIDFGDESAEYSGQVSPHRLPPQPRRFMQRTRSSEQLHVNVPRAAAPPRPPRSPVEQSSFFNPPVPPPRLSSRTSLRYDGVDPLSAVSLDRPQTTTGFRQSQPFCPPQSSSGPEPSASSHAFTALPSDSDAFHIRYFSHALTTPDDAAWPLTGGNAPFSYDTALPDVPEEDENHAHPRRSRMSFSSNRSSLRGSQSVPLLFQTAQMQSGGPERRPSGASDTLGRSDGDAAQRALETPETYDDDLAGVSRESWEDDIDYCYEHEAEADFDYAWDRPSLDVVRRSEFTQYGDNDDDSLNIAHRVGDQADGVHMSPNSPVYGHEAVTPIVNEMLATGDDPSWSGNEGARRRPGLLHVRTSSQASSFKESHGFNLSPSLLIPDDFQRQMTAAQFGMKDFSEDFLSPERAQSGYADVHPMTMSTSGLYTQDRTSTSTTGSNSTGHTGSSTGRHISTSSNLTAMTRYTGSTMYEGWNPKVLESEEPLPSVNLEEFPEFEIPQSPKARKNPSRESELASSSTGDIREHAYGTGISSMHEGLDNQKAKESASLYQRKRAHTTSLSTPSRGYALFPPAYAGNRV